MAVASLSPISRIQRFSLVGIAGFVVDAGVLSLLTHSSLAVDPFSARIVSIAIAMLTTWRLNRAFTFGASGTSQAAEGARYGLVAVAAAFLNYGVYALLMLSFPALIPAIGVVIATLTSMMVSYLGYSRLAFRKGESVAQGGTVFEPYTGVEELHVLADAHNYNRALSRFVSDYAQDGDAVLDFGAGLGSFSPPRGMTPSSATCLEPDEHLFATLKARGLDVVQSPAEVADASIDYAYTLNVLEHIEDDTGAIRELHRMIRPGGRLAVYVPALAWLYTGMDRKVGHWRRYGRRELVGKLQAAGFRIERVRYADSLGVPATLLFKLIDDGKGDVSPKSVALYDRIAFPLSHLIDRLTFGALIGKNLAVYAVRD